MKIFRGLVYIVEILQIQKKYQGPLGNSRVFERIVENILKLYRHFRVSRTLNEEQRNDICQGNYFHI